MDSPCNHLPMKGHHAYTKSSLPRLPPPFFTGIVWFTSRCFVSLGTQKCNDTIPLILESLSSENIHCPSSFFPLKRKIHMRAGENFSLHFKDTIRLSDKVCNQDFSWPLHLPYDSMSETQGHIRRLMSGVRCLSLYEDSCVGATTCKYTHTYIKKYKHTFVLNCWNFKSKN